MAAAKGWTNARSAAGRHNPWLIVGIISMATFMEVLDTSIANVSLDHIAGGLAASQDEAAWVLTSYLVSNAIIIPISGWLSDVIGRKRYYMISVALFTLSSLMCGLSPNLGTLIFARILQGIGGGGLAPSEQSILADTFPPEQRGKAFAAYGVVVVCGPILGPTLGGWITDNISWHWIFLINVPVGILSLALVQAFLQEPKALQDERKALLKKGLNVDYIGFVLVALGLGCLDITLDRGERDDWFGSGFITTTAIVSAVSLVLLVVWELNRKDPIVNLRLLGNRNFGITTLFMFAAGMVIFGTTQLIPQFAQQVLGYTATNAGLALTTGGIATLLMMPLTGVLSGRVDTRLLLVPALALQAAAFFVMTGWNSSIAYGDISTARLISAAGLPFVFIPINAAAYVGLKPDQTNQASALLNVARNLGGSICISLAQAGLIERGQVNQSYIVEGLSPLNPNYNQGLDQLGQTIGNVSSSGNENLGALYQQVQTQASTLAYIDVFHVLMIFVLLIIPLALFLRQGKAGAGAHGG
ncbi:DHA2 family efflux MFS transporter permease subunit [Sphingomonas nostoxanthinifaciens]|uniref:DHA2 family efflux MFS transporter permease subunit n=1 Tax=Sphingomonas nostoxanthinifaciens TaxID=2872652 RepID=UPI001CC1F392|nr:DHA2 family efflux MFS transporter permease subunit [Sphingomonas nostoxanthinifaciens]UAK26376.1 DHA2 family efflux MFS transporter permease subunit [Sphingomonas nostoxanthinifaciens]